jgi:hypothetical protein
MKKTIIGFLLLVGLLFAQVPFTGKIILLDQNATDPIYQLPLSKYSKWLCEAELKNKKKIQFVSVKSMMKIYMNQEHFIKHGVLPAGIRSIYIQDYLSGKKVDATRAYYVFGSRIVGPHGDDLIPFATEENAKLFMMKNGGTKILPYARISKGLIRYLDM